MTSTLWTSSTSRATVTRDATKNPNDLSTTEVIGIEVSVDPEKGTRFCAPPLARLDDDEKGLRSVETPGGIQRLADGAPGSGPLLRARGVDPGNAPRRLTRRSRGIR